MRKMKTKPLAKGTGLARMVSERNIIFVCGDYLSFDTGRPVVKTNTD